MLLTILICLICPTIQEVLHQCENRHVVFDNRTLDQRKKNEQVQELLTLVNLVVAKNGGRPYTDESMKLKVIILVQLCYQVITNKLFS